MTRNYWFIVLTLCCSLSVLQPAQAHARCDRVEGRFEGVFEFTNAPGEPTTGKASGKLTGDLAGTFSAEYFNFVVFDKVATTLNGRHAFSVGGSAAGNVLLTFDKILLFPDPTNANKVTADSILEIVGGTGIYEGAIGSLDTGNGGVDFTPDPSIPTGAGKLSIGYKGKFCRPDKHR